MGTLYRIVHEEPPRLPDAGWLGALLGATMAREPADRWPMSQVRDALRAGTHPAAAAPTLTFPAAPPPVVEDRAADGPRQGIRADRRPRRAGVVALVAGAAAVIVAGLLGWALLAGDDSPGRGNAPTAAGPSSSRSPEASTGSTSEVPPPIRAVRPLRGCRTSSTVTWPRSPRTRARPSTCSRPSSGRPAAGSTATRASGTRSALRRSVVHLDRPRRPHHRLHRPLHAANGSTSTDETSLQLAFRDGRYRIAGES